MAASPEADQTARRVMLALTGHRWTWPARNVTEEYWLGETVNDIHLTGRPVTEVVSVVDRWGNVYLPFDPTNTTYQYWYQMSDRFRMRFPRMDPAVWPNPIPSVDANFGMWGSPYARRGTYITVNYTYGAPPPIDVQRAIDEFASQLDYASCSDSRCKLPERVTSVSREGVSWTVLDPQQFLEGGKLGLYYPDLIISAYGNKVRARARVWTPERPPPRRLSSSTVSS